MTSRLDGRGFKELGVRQLVRREVVRPRYVFEGRVWITFAAIGGGIRRAFGGGRENEVKDAGGNLNDRAIC